MNKANNRFEKLDQKRMLSVEEAALYMGIGRTNCRKVLAEIGAAKKIGSRVLCDKIAIDQYLESLETA